MKVFTGNRLGDAGAGPVILCVAQFMVVLDLTMVATALPAIDADLGFSPTQLIWVITAYTVVLSGLLILGGRVTDLVGTRRMFRISLIVFTAASLACAVAWAPAALLTARIAQGAGAALLSPAALAALNELIKPAQARRRALGWWTAAAAGGGASGWVLGGVLQEVVGWRWIFAINAPIGLTALICSRRLPCGRHRSSAALSRALDLAGALFVTTGIALVTLGLSRVAQNPRHWMGWIAIALAAALLARFAQHERRTDDPLVPGRLFRTPGVPGGNLTAAALTACTTPAMLTVVLYVQNTLRLPPARGSLLFPAFNIAVVAGSLVGPRLLARTGARAALLTGFGAIIAGALVLLTLPSRGLPIGTLLSSFTLMGAGLGAASVASTTAGTVAVSATERGVAAGLLNSTAQVGTSLGLALTTPLLAAAAPMTGYQLGFATAALIAIAGMLLALTVPRRSPEAASRTSDSKSRSKSRCHSPARTGR